jgi:hypothetical protein
MNLLLFSIVIVVIVFLFIPVISIPVEDKSNKDFFDGLSLSKMTIGADYVGGLEKVLEKTRCSMILMKDKINVRIAFKGVDILIPFSQIINVELLSEQEIKRNSLIAKLFEGKKVYIAKKDKKASDNNFLIVSYFDSEKEAEQVLIFEYADSKTFLDTYKKIFNEWTYEQYSENELSIGKVCALDSFN